MQVQNVLSHKAASLTVAGVLAQAVADVDEADDDDRVEWSEEDIVFLHWRLLREIGDLKDPATPLDVKLDTLRWIFTDPEKEDRPFSFVSCLKVVASSPLSPLPYLGQLDADEIRDAIQLRIKAWLRATLEKYPEWIRDAVVANPEWIERGLARNPQWINEEIRKRIVQPDLFA
jgi:hypothetical protein